MPGINITERKNKQRGSLYEEGDKDEESIEGKEEGSKGNEKECLLPRGRDSEFGRGVGVVQYRV